MKKERTTQNITPIQSIICLFLSCIQNTHAQEPTLNIANKATISIETARTPEERDRGLMFRRLLSPKHGMLFDFKTTQTVSMWMKNTYVSLDILFISARGKIVQIVPQTTPLSTAAIPSKQPARFALELPAGTCKKHNIRTGDQVHGLPKNQNKAPQKKATKRKKGAP